MITYRYKGISSSGTEVEGIIEAFDQQDAMNRARENCRVLVSVEPASKGKAADLMSADIGDLLGGGKIKPKKLALLCSQLAIELKAGLPLVASLRLVAENEDDKKVKAMMEDVADDVQAGHPLSDSFAARGPGLPRTFIETLRAGEQSGKLDSCFDRLEKYYENAANVGSKVGSALIYPILLIVVAVVVIAVIMLKAVPVFEQSFASMGNELPFPTRALIAMSHFFTDNILLIILVIAVIALAISVYKKTDSGRHFFGRLALNFPGIGMVNRMNAACQFSSTMSTMLSAGLTLVQSASITSEVVDNCIIGEEINAANEGVVEGRRLSEGLSGSEYLPGMLVEMTAVGEETGEMEKTLDVVNEYYNKEVTVAVDNALGIMEPAIVLVLAGMVVFILLSVYLPLFSLY